MREFFWSFLGLTSKVVIAASLALISSCSNADERQAADSDRQIRTANTVEMDATLRSFADIARYDWNAAMEMTALPAVVTEWRKQNGAIFESPISSSAFFRNPFFLLSSTGKGRWIGGIYNLWIDKWLLLEFVWQDDVEADRIAGFAWISGGDPYNLDQGVDGDEMSARLQTRLDRAVDAGRVGAFKLLEGQSDDPMFLKTAPSAELEEYVGRMRAALAPEGSPALAALRRELNRFYKQMEAGEQEWAAEINERIELPASLTPDFLSVRDDTATIVMSAPPNPYLFVLVQFELKNAEPVFKGIDFHQLSLNEEEEQ